MTWIVLWSILMYITVYDQECLCAVSGYIKVCLAKNCLLHIYIHIKISRNNNNKQQNSQMLLSRNCTLEFLFAIIIIYWVRKQWFDFVACISLLTLLEHCYYGAAQNSNHCRWGQLWIAWVALNVGSHDFSLGQNAWMMMCQFKSCVRYPSLK